MDETRTSHLRNVPGEQPLQPFRSILFGPDEEGAIAPLKQPDCFIDLNLDQIVIRATGPKQEYDLAPFFFQPLRDPATLAWRHGVFRDLERPEIGRALTDFSARMRDLRAAEKQRLAFHHACQQQGQLLISVGTYIEAVKRLLEDLTQVAPSSDALVAFWAWLRDYIESERFVGMLADRAACQSALDEVRYSLLIHGSSVRVTHYAETEDYSAVIADTFAKFAQVEGHAYTWKFQNFYEMNHVEAAIADYVALLFPGPFRILAEFATSWASFSDEVILRFDREIQFYLAWLDCLAPLKRTGLSAVLPELSLDSKAEWVTGAYDLALAFKLVEGGQSIVTNDFKLVGQERVIVVSGPNQGGKTTFARMFGQIHWLAALGLPVPGIKARLFLFDRVFTHFERAETVETERGKLEDEVFRIHEILKGATSASLIVINEIFASTSVSDAVDLATRVMNQIIALDCLAVCVTFLDEVSRQGSTVVSMTSTVVAENPAERTFRIIRQPADGNAFAIFLARRHGLTTGQLLERIKL